MKIYPIPAFGDNYLWLVANGTRALAVDPGDATPVLAALDRHHLTLDTILITHHHGDHIGGVAELVRRTGARVYGPADERIAEVTDPINLPNSGITARAPTFWRQTSDERDKDPFIPGDLPVALSSSDYANNIRLLAN